jgi:lipopolysaccharide biosynthesis protein
MTSAVSSRLRSALFHVLRAAFRALPISKSTQDRLRQQFLDRFPTIRPRNPRGVPATGLPRRPYVHSGGRALGYVEHRVEPLPDPLPATLVAFYLPQFHTIPENDEWWGKGFTEWRNVARALPQFEGHAQPRLPGDLGFYDLRNPQVMRDQAKLAREYGISAFCFYFYWFGGKTLLEEPLQQWLNDPSIDLSFCLCWANENWSRRWDGRAEDILIAQSHSAEDDLAFICHVAAYLRDPRYVRVDGKPLLLVYRPGQLPNARATAIRWRNWCRSNGIGEICIGYVQSFEQPHPDDIGFDVAVEFPPNLSTPPNITGNQRLLNRDYSGEVLDWRGVATDYSHRAMPDYRLFPGVNCGWDNEARRAGAGRMYFHATPRSYRQWLSTTVFQRLERAPEHDRVVFINAWNEWAEGAVLEPDARVGYAWLDATRRALNPPASLVRSPDPCIVLHAWHPEILGELLNAVLDSGVHWRVFVTTAYEKETAVRRTLSSFGINAELIVIKNRGRDILPFLTLARELERRGHDGVILKIHTKRSLHRADGDTWRRDLLGPLLDRSTASKILDAFSQQPDLGMIVPAGHLLETAEYAGANEQAMDYLRRLCGMGENSEEQQIFASGSMYYVRIAAIRSLLDADLDIEQFEPEAGQIDGTLAHAVERVIASTVLGAKFKVLGVSAAGELAAPVPTKDYAFSGKSS